MRSGPLVALLVGAVLVVLYLAPTVRAQGTPAVGAISDFRVTAVDTNGNGKYDALVATFNATVTVAGNFRFSAQLVAGYYYPIVTNNTDVNLAVGAHPMNVSVPGPWIYNSGLNGPYDFRLTVIPVDDTGAMTYSGIGPADAFTPAYNATDFDAPWAYYGSPITDQGVDADGNGLYDALVVHVPIVVNRTSYVQVMAYLSSPYGYSISSDPTEARLLTAGAHTVDLSWGGIALHQATNLFSGPLTVQLSLVFPGLLAGTPYYYYGPSMSRFSYPLAHTYAASQFERASAYFSASSATTTAQDTNGNGLTDFLVFHLPLTVRVAGDYVLGITLPSTTFSGVPGGGTIVHLSAGNQTADVSVSGIAMSRMGTTMPSVRASVSRLGSTSYFDQDYIIWTLPNFQPSSFESRPVSTLSVYANVGNTSCAIAYAWDPANRYLAFASSYYGFSGPLPLPLYDGTFYVVAEFCASYAALAVQKVTVSGSTSVTMNVSAPKPLAESIGIGVPSWNSTNMRLSASLGGEGGLYRMIADFYGNADGIAESNELANIASLLTSGYGYLGAYGAAREDGVSLPFATRFSATFSGAGEITSSTALSYTIEYLAFTGNTPKAGDHHRFVIDLSYATQQVTETVTVSVGASAGGNLSLVSRMVVYDGDGFTWPANATATKTSATSWSIAVGQRPQNAPSNVQLEIIVDAYGTPPPSTSNLLDYVTNPLAVVLIVVVVAVAAFALLARRKKGPAPPSPPST